MQLQNHWQSMRRKSSVASSGIFEMKPQRQEQIFFIRLQCFFSSFPLTEDADKIFEMKAE